MKAAWESSPDIKNIIAMMATGAGKTKLMAHAFKEHMAVPGAAAVAMAHRSVLIGQISMALCEEGLQHDIVAQKKIVKAIVAKQIKKFGRSFYNPSSLLKVASVDTMPGRAAALASWIARVTLGATDEAHHVLKKNKWGLECLRFTHPDMRWILPTATPERADGQGLGWHAAGIAHALIEGPMMRPLIEQGYLTDYYVRAPIPADLDLSDVTVGANGEYNMVQLRRAMHRSKKILGNIVDTYVNNTMGMLGIAFAVDIEHAIALTKEFNDKGVPAELITGDDDEDTRNAIMERYEARQTLVLVNVDLFGEGFDLPALEVVMMGRPTASFSLYAQQWGRGGRLGISKYHMDRWESYSVLQRKQIIATSPKPAYYVHDHVGNIIHFRGPPDKPRTFSLDGRVKGAASGAIPLRSCLSCHFPFERFLVKCPRCNAEVAAPAAPTLPEQVDGDILLYTPEMFKKLFGVSTAEEALALKPDEFCAIPHNLPSQAAARAIQDKHQNKLRQQRLLAKVMPLTMPPSLSERENNRRFYLRYGVDVVAARRLGGADTEVLVEKIKQSLTNR